MPGDSGLGEGELTAVLRSWEERFDAIVVAVGFATLSLAVRRPPRERSARLAVAAELGAFCPERIDADYGSLEELAEGMAGEIRWWFWWD